MSDRKQLDFENENLFLSSILTRDCFTFHPAIHSQ